MCDTMVTFDKKNNHFIFAKNSDRNPTEIQLIQYVDGKEGLKEATHPVKKKEYDEIQYKKLVEVAKEYKNSYKALISRPSWIWGAEMGVNEKGVAIGNEALFARSKVEKEGLLGMDILRLALHNSKDAKAAVSFITTLLEKHGQGGNGSFKGSLRYHNSFLITDGKHSYVIESAKRKWVVKKIDSFYSISNAYTIEDDYDSSDSTTASGTNFKDKHASRFYLLFTKGDKRRAKSMELLEKNAPPFSILRYNKGTAEKLDRSMCSIAIDSKGLAKSRTTSSMVVQYTDDGPAVWITNSPFPTFSPFFPLSLEPTKPFDKITDSFKSASERFELAEEIANSSERKKRKVASCVKDFEKGFRDLKEYNFVKEQNNFISKVKTHLK